MNTLDADRALKTKHREMWALGDYPSVSSDLLEGMGRRLVDAAGVSPEHRVLDVAAGAGNVALIAASAGAQVVASDLTPELLAVGRELAARHGLTLDWKVADAEALPFGEGEFDVVLSCVGVMFAPHHRAAADELVRVCKPGGTIALASWTPEGFIGRMFATMKPYVAPPPPGVQPPPLWGDEGHVRDLFGDRLTDLETRREAVRIERFATPEEFRDYFKARYGPTIAAYRGIADDGDRVAALDRELADLARRHDIGTDATLMDWEYLLVTGRKAG